MMKTLENRIKGVAARYEAGAAGNDETAFIVENLLGKTALRDDEGVMHLVADMNGEDIDYKEIDCLPQYGYSLRCALSLVPKAPEGFLYTVALVEKPGNGAAATILRWQKLDRTSRGWLQVGVAASGLVLPNERLDREEALACAVTAAALRLRAELIGSEDART